MRKTNKPIYERGKYKLIYDRKRDGSLRTPFIQIVWYDDERRRVRSISTGTENPAHAEHQLDALYEKTERGRAICPACGQNLPNAAPYLLTEAIAAYIEARKSRTSISSIRPRLAHILNYLEATSQIDVLCTGVDEEWIDEFREWNIEVPIEAGTDEEGNPRFRDRAAGTVEASIRQLAAAINLAEKNEIISKKARFSPRKPKDVSHTPTYRAPVPILAGMFRYCTEPDRRERESDRAYQKRLAGRRELLRFLQISVATWARPDAAHDVSTDPSRGQWDPQERNLNLNPKGRVQTKKYRPTVPIARQMIPLLEAHQGFYVSVSSVRQAWEAMQTQLGLPQDREAGLKLVRRSVAQLARKRMSKSEWIEGTIMLGHHRPTTSDLYGFEEAGDLPTALRVTEEIIDEIVALAPLAFEKLGNDRQGDACDR
jgi:hypothetical protein